MSCRAAAVGVAVVTGAGRGIGREIAERLARLGWDLGLTSRTPAELSSTAGLAREAGRAVVAMEGDVSVPQHVDALCANVEDRLGPVDVLVNNAGVSGEYTTTCASDLEQWWRVLEINVRSPFLLCHRLVPGMVSRGRGYVVNVNSLDCTRSARVGSPAYSVSKTALRRFTEILALELEGTGVTAVDLSPGLVRTAMGASRPDADKIAPEAWMHASVAADKVEQLLSGGYALLSGRFLHAKDDFDHVMGVVARSEYARLLRLVPAGDDDPLLSYGAITSHHEDK